MIKETAIKLFEQKKIRSVWKEEDEKWYFSIIDVIEALTGSDRSRKYWSDLKAKLQKEGSELSEKIGQLKLAAEDGKMRLTEIIGLPIMTLKKEFCNIFFITVRQLLVN